MNVLVIGSGAREHALAWKLTMSPQVRDIYVAPGNGGTGFIARNLDIPALDFDALIRAVIMNGIDLTVVGPDNPLAAGIVDRFQERGLPVFGPTKAAARIEASKVFAKELMLRHGIPCASGEVFDSSERAKAYVEQHPMPVVVKADGLAQGKGVTVCSTREEAIRAVEVAMEERVFGAAGDRIIVEECLVGREVSLLAFVDGETVVPMAPACDYKRVFDGDEGPNTGSMGAYSPPSFFTSDMVEQVRKTILEPAVRALAQEGSPYTGVLYAGLMVTQEGPKVLEFNARFGDPEAQVVLPQLQSDLVDLLLACVHGRLHQQPIRWSQEACVGVVLASAGYPGEYQTGFSVEGLDQLEDGVLVFHAGTKARQWAPPGWRDLWRGRPETVTSEVLSGRIETAGGRVLTVVARGQSVAEARRKVYANVSRIRFEGCHYRTDIAAREEQEVPGGNI